MSISYHKIFKNNTELSPAEYDGTLILSPLNLLKSKGIKAVCSIIGARKGSDLAEFGQHRKFRPKQGALLVTDVTAKHRIALAVAEVNAPAFVALSKARQFLAPLLANRCAKILVDLRNLTKEDARNYADALIAANIASQFDQPNYKSGKKPPLSHKAKLFFIAHPDHRTQLTETCDLSAHEANGTNLVRSLMIEPANKLTCKSYVQRVRQIATEQGLKVEVINQAKLQKMGAGAILAVAQGSAHSDAAIVKLTYKPEQSKASGKKLALVGKGIVFDTGGVNIKTGNYMFGMHGDMGGSAVALATCVLASQQQWPEEVTAYLAIADNAVSNEAYRPNEVIKSLSGKTIEIVHTDAEGRMALADTLCLAAKAKPDLIIDFATLTGSAIRAIGTTYSCGFTNTPSLHEQVRKAGVMSGERVWTFPLDEDFGKSLDSDVADIKQCRLNGGVDHIEAAYFLSQFIGKGDQWVHIDLSAAENTGGLAHVGAEVTGFGVRFTSRLIAQLRN